MNRDFPKLNVIWRENQGVRQIRMGKKYVTPTLLERTLQFASHSIERDKRYHDLQDQEHCSQAYTNLRIENREHKRQQDALTVQ